MWSTISSLKDNISQIASDVLDTAQELEAGGNYRDADGNDGPPALSVFSPVREQADEEREAQLNWYKAEVRRLAESETEIQALSMNYVKLLKEKEEEVRSLWTLSEELKAKLATNDAERARKEAENCRAEIEQLKRQNAALTEELKRAREIQQEQIASLQERHQKRMESLLARHKRELASVHVQTVAQSSENEQGPHASKDSPAGDESTDGCADVAGLTEQVRQLKQQIEWAREREKELADQVVEKDNLYGRLKDTHETALAELQAMKVSLENEKAAVEDVGDQLERSQVMAEASARECNMLKGERQHIRAECEQARQELEKLQLETRSTMKATMVAHERQLANVQAERESLQKELDLANKEADRMRLQVKAKMLADSDDLLNGRIAKGLPPNAAELESQADEC
ncbi:hypothetical protein CBR_g40298 [Chara braunii]|uniref:Uncharacterized protein n=1 Tax=Chara braunii TaxID=69332 RepID=A0A388K1W7_CHABU|nr:hypothetical protein CBR_g40298 [Chara braunii]|eukprot:GBG64051.1 hypothetical protein CBR_g40298 [Chara braunii]